MKLLFGVLLINLAFDWAVHQHGVAGMLGIFMAPFGGLLLLQFAEERREK